LPGRYSDEARGLTSEESWFVSRQVNEMYLFSSKPLEELWVPPRLLFSGYHDLDLFTKGKKEAVNSQNRDRG
jgi:hypothetical protein